MEDITTFNNDSYGGNFGFNGFNYLDPSNIADPSQTYAGVDVMGAWNNYPDFLTLSTTPTSLDPPNVVDPYEGKSCRTLITAVQSFTL